MKSFLYTIVVLFGALTVAQANTETKPVAEEEAIVIEDVKANADSAESEVKKEETKEVN